MAASEVKKGDFVYRDTLFVEVAENKRHTRASAPELKELLLPKKGSAPAKDQVAHWYEAQLVHYGLPRTKDKNTAKVRLTTALVSDTLRVPSNVTQLEAEMKKEFASNIRKAKAAEKKTQESKAADQAASKGKKRKADDNENTSTTKVSVKVGDVTFEINHTGGPASKKTKAEPAASKKAAPKSKVLPPTPTKAAKSRSTITKTAEAKSTLPKTAKPKLTTPKSPASKPSSKPASVPTPSPARPKQTARRSKPSQYGSQSSRPAASPPQQVHDHTPASFYDSDIDMDDDPPPYDSHDFNEVNGPSNDMGLDLVSGFYNISTYQSTLSGVLTLTIFQSAGQAWGNFRIGSKLESSEWTIFPVLLRFGTAKRHPLGGGARTMTLGS
ncbi:hypothetical protein LTR10_011575 [Elasticomyces elasticus]|uniref:Uncharacterized protein n=1 Tax=Exophiala sideris TaxID=1016849 RepID=A0ABR0JCV6_9EURO|nr:hypothetical protein LTR10_011575 [Elasticomyces elasticus]KAK5031968.1 hypothetical protein LTS07_004589 [Exophiala sideris]KAK5040897.1 hypothetical protein LTR13_003198 [Exophiala sideris]KAK5061769.1 hypothetical protein LTR69_004952 [Exophiala sideris]KAK5184469.1 hypothetical protein LTR44_003143 [Eurotiomycetes sp. CCFEE 6388]